MNEFEFIRMLRDEVRSRKHSSRLVQGIGDDAAVISQIAGRDTVISTDLLVEGIDFYREATPPRLLGHKALAVSLSDIAAMGARPMFSMVSIGLARGTWEQKFTNEFFAGYLALADQFSVTLAGGDVSETRNESVIDSIIIGEVRNGATITRAGAKPGDQVYITGTLGGAAAGLKLIELGARLSEPPAAAGGPLGSDDESIQTLLLRQLKPHARVGWGIVLGDERLATAMIDVSDGLSSDLGHLCEESNVGALVQADSLPLNEDVVKLCGRRALDPLALALHGGEDFELLFTVAPGNSSRLPTRVDGVSISRIGEITDEANTIRIAEKTRVWELKPEGFEHFKH